MSILSKDVVHVEVLNGSNQDVLISSEERFADLSAIGKSTYLKAAYIVCCCMYSDIYASMAL